MTTPEVLFPGARVALICLSSAVPQERLAPAVAAVRALGLDPVLYPSCYEENRHGYLAAGDVQRARDLTDAFADSSIHGVLAIRGGYGAHRILPLLDWELFRRNPKLLAGYSDVTAVHIALNQLCELVTYHTPMPSTEYYAPMSDYTMEHLKRALFGGLHGPLLNPAGEGLRCLVPGRVTAPLCGGNLSLVAASLGTKWELDTRGKILFLEDIGEKTYRIDAMLTQLRNAGKFDDCAGILLGQWTDCVPEHPARTLTLDEIFTDLLVPAGKPILANLACGHCEPTMSLPLGAMVTMGDEVAGTHMGRKTMNVPAILEVLHD